MQPNPTGCIKKMQLSFDLKRTGNFSKFQGVLAAAHIQIGLAVKVHVSCAESLVKQWY